MEKRPLNTISVDEMNEFLAINSLYKVLDVTTKQQQYINFNRQATKAMLILRFLEKYNFDLSNIDVPPESSYLHPYNIWREGYCITGDSDKHKLLAQNIFAPNFHNAITKWYNSLSEEEQKQMPLRYDTDTKTYNIWGCKLFDNEIDAKRNFG